MRAAPWPVSLNCSVATPHPTVVCMGTGPNRARPLETLCLGFCVLERTFTLGACLRRQPLGVCIAAPTSHSPRCSTLFTQLPSPCLTPWWVPLRCLCAAPRIPVQGPLAAAVADAPPPQRRPLPGEGHAARRSTEQQKGGTAWGLLTRQHAAR